MALNHVGKLSPPSQIKGQHVFAAGSQDILPENADLQIPALLCQTVQPTTQTISQTPVCEVTEEELFIEPNLFYSSGEHSATVVKGRLRSNLKFWKNIGASTWVIDIIRDGYSLPFLEKPAKKFFNINDNHIDFVSKELKKLVSTGAIVEVNKSELVVCSPLGVVCNASGKLRLIVDLRYVNKHLRVTKFKYEDIRTACDLFMTGDWFFKFDYKSGYHHVDIFPDHAQFLGCSWTVNGQFRYFKFMVLPFGLATAPFLFTKIQKALVKHWRRQGLRVFTYLDDGAGAESNYESAKEMSLQVQQDIYDSGFVVNDEKSQWDPVQCGELLGFVINLATGLFTVPERRVLAFMDMLKRVVDNSFIVSARHLAQLSGSLSSMGLALGPVVRLWTRELYRAIQQSTSWDQRFQLSEDGKNEICFWHENFANSGQPIWTACPTIDVMTYSDASDVAWGGYAVQLGGQTAVGSWSEEESVQSSTFRELRAARLVLQSMASQLEGKEVRHRTDNQSAERIMTVGSRNPDLHKEAILLYKICRKHNIRLSVEWVSRNQNETADALSRFDDPDDYKLDPSVFRAIDQLWGPHTYDRFASMITTQLPRFSSKYMNPKCDSTDAFTVCWLGENNWLFPPPYLIPRVIRHMSANKEYGTLLIPYWPSAPWWPLLITKQGTWNWFVTDCLDISPYNGIFITGSLSSNIFTTGVPPFELRALRLQFG